MKKIALPPYTFLEKLRAIPVVEKILLYGSRARGDNTERSDIDLAIVCPGAMAADWQNILDIIEHADTLLAIDCVRFDTLSDSNPLKKAIIRDSIVLYEKDHA